ncbi:ATP-binding protein [Microbacterium ureisolvens]|uniref:ATP-binding protein n=1 Tax=Microbacterium ureisolvens TaxID=2781186 RepID=UPI003632E874
MSPGTGIDWTHRNQARLAAELDRVRGLLQRYLDSGEPGEVEPLDRSVDVDIQADRSAVDELVALFGLSPFETDLLLACAGVELDASFAELCRREGGGSVTFALALAALPGAHWSAVTPSAPLRYWRIIEVGPGDGLLSAPLRIDERMLHFLAGVPCTDERLLELTRPHRGQGGLPPSHERLAESIAALWSTAAAADTAPPSIQVVGEEDAGLEEVTAAACDRHGLRLRITHARDIPRLASEREQLARTWEREAALEPSALLIRTDDAEGESRAAVAAFVERCRGFLVLAGRDMVPLAGHPLPRFDIGKPAGAEQAESWRRALEPLTVLLERSAGNGDGPSVRPRLDEQVDRLVDQFSLGNAAIANAAAQTVSLAASEEVVDVAAAGALLWAASRDQARARLDDLAQRIQTPPTWDDLVLPPLQQQILRDIVTHVRHRGQVHERWGFAARHSRGLGISALFAGPSGTGKTLAAEILANELQLDLYRIDLSQVVSKYIGETEKNLRRVFDAAETAGAVLLFDEADALFGKRSEVKDSHDRYANIEVSYLLQRMEAYRGLAILTTNMKQALDPAFARRIRFIVQFPFPDPGERAEIWRRVFPAATPTEGLDEDRLARLNVAGGNIRNIAMGAAFLAADDGQPVTMPHLLRAARAEYAKLERPLTDGEVAGWVT